jgi:hypothetical protein
MYCIREIEWVTQPYNTHLEMSEKIDQKKNHEYVHLKYT